MFAYLLLEGSNSPILTESGTFILLEGSAPSGDPSIIFKVEFNKTKFTASDNKVKFKASNHPVVFQATS